MATAGERRAAADVLAKAKARLGRVRLLLDGDLVDQHEQMSAELGKLNAESPEAKALAARVLDLESEMQKAEIEFVFQAMGRGRWLKMMADHPPTDEQAKQGAQFDTDTFPFVAMAECLVEPEVTVEALRTLNDEVLTEGQFGSLWASCLKANIGGGSRPESLAAHAIAANGGGKSKPRSNSGFPARS